MELKGSLYRRSICVDYMHYNSDGTIQMIEYTDTGSKTNRIDNLKDFRNHLDIHSIDLSHLHSYNL